MQNPRESFILYLRYWCRLWCHTKVAPNWICLKFKVHWERCMWCYSATWCCWWPEVHIEWCEDVTNTVAAASRCTWLWRRSCLHGYLLFSVGQGTVAICCFAVEELWCLIAPILDTFWRYQYVQNPRESFMVTTETVAKNSTTIYIQDSIRASAQNKENSQLIIWQINSKETLSYPLDQSSICCLGKKPV